MFNSHFMKHTKIHLKTKLPPNHQGLTVIILNEADRLKLKGDFREEDYWQNDLEELIIWDEQITEFQVQ